MGMNKQKQTVLSGLLPKAGSRIAARVGKLSNDLQNWLGLYRCFGHLRPPMYSSYEL